MSGKHCRLYDENLVHNIMVSTGLSVFEYLRQSGTTNSQEICEFIEANASSIIEDTIENLNAEDSEENRRNDEPSNNQWSNE